MTISTAACADLVSDVLQREYGHVRHVADRMARRHGWSARAWQNWWCGTNPPRMADLVVLMAECPLLEAEVLRLVTEVRGRS